MSVSDVAARVWSVEQQAIFDFIENDNRSLMVVAGAGAGKTTTGVEAYKRVSFMDSAIFLAFSKRIQETLEEKLGKNKAKTFNSLGNSALRKHNEGRFTKLDPFKISALVRAASDSYNQEFRSDVTKLVGLAKGIGLVPRAAETADLWPLVDDRDAVWLDLAEEYDLDFGKVDRNRAVQLARRVLLESIAMSEEVIDYNDQLYMPVITNASFTKYDYLFVDEAQDVNEIQREIIRRSLVRGGRLIAIGDPNQAIYGFRGAGKDSMRLLQEEFNAESLPLSVSYRCARKIVADANQQVAWLQPRADAPEGKIEHVYSFPHEEYLKSDVILCRLNAPLVEHAFRLIARDIPCRVLGRDIGAGLISLVKKMHAESVPDLERRLLRHLESERSRLIAEGKPYKINSLQDRIDTVFVFTRQMQNASIADLLNRILSLFDDEVNPNRITLSTIHKAKGLEWNRVFILKYDLIGAWSVPGIADQEDNLRYVAKTRAQNELIYISE